jgi:hypothetical protein
MPFNEASAVPTLRYSFLSPAGPRTAPPLRAKSKNVNAPARPSIGVPEGAIFLALRRRQADRARPLPWSFLVQRLEPRSTLH